MSGQQAKERLEYMILLTLMEVGAGEIENKAPCLGSHYTYFSRINSQ